MLPTLLKCIQDSETRVDEPDPFLPTADKTLDNLEVKDLSIPTRPTPGSINWTLTYVIQLP